ncbi:HesA/MoeB/ThiF family protein [Vibrio taketomensis]|uniref:HesA/MoeB/ThiF family protein n=1 Tax=Vibrio taketomensis TaxID=2572923 RepID=UPI0013897186|nr:HesA/MoeB/ThiF family protein [Vibrio taketomensis]
MLNDQQFIRYQRQICLPEINEQGQQRIMDSKVLIIGCGGLGSAASLYLSAAGVGRLVIVDDDCVDVSNLQRQVVYRQENVGQNKVEAMSQQLKQLNPDVSVRTVAKRLTEVQLNLEIMMADVVLDCCDNIKTRQQINQACFQQKTPLVSGAAIGWNGQFSVYDFGSNDACYRCLYPFDEIVNPQSCSQSGIVGPVVGILGNYQALAVIQKLATGRFMVSSNQLHIFDGKSMQWQQLSIHKDSQCSVCGVSAVSFEVSEVEEVNDAID